jgi:hypothetical protein
MLDRLPKKVDAFLLVALGLVAAGAHAPAAPARLAAQQPKQELIVCGWDEVFILDVSRPGAPSKVWRWKAADRPEIPELLKTKFRTVADCKPVSGNRILLVASGDGVALVERATGKAVFWGACANAHSADLLPGDRIAVACSTRDVGGNRLAVFDARTPERELYSTELYSGHGALWDESRRRLWALGGRELRTYALTAWDTGTPSLRLDASYPLPSTGGHELVEAADSRQLAVTALRQAWFFDRDARTFSPHPELSERVGVKSISVHPTTKQVAYTQADAPEWWTATIRFLHPEKTITLEGERIYKVRWVR